MKKLLAAGAVAGLVLLGGALPASAVPAEGQICPGFDSGKIDVTEDVTSIRIDAPEGQLITAVCVKAGPTAEITTFDPGRTFVILEHSTLKDISHYSVQFDEDGGYGS
jgi:hypothetical protein